ncbi:hypothetical protein EVAR_24451_1 [Eumeta japonica]|uniref:SCAN domain-containing protein 3 n=1 Tax=Eumeta variegata TaxID=151549 RepID=A0A4C1WYW7_EUMVA|nr:hypothetical protein EVAR_24451_1 [Eumeta japonica]
MKPSRLQDHFNKMHPDKKDKNVAYFQDLEKKHNAQPSVSKLFSVAAKQDDDGLRASYNISLLIAHTVSCNNDNLLVYCQHLENLHSNFIERFQDILKLEIPDWVLDPFSNVNIAISPQLEEELIELTTNEEIKIKYKNGYQQFWLQKSSPQDCGLSLKDF